MKGNGRFGCAACMCVQQCGAGVWCMLLRNGLSRPTSSVSPTGAHGAALTHHTTLARIALLHKTNFHGLIPGTGAGVVCSVEAMGGCCCPHNLLPSQPAQPAAATQVAEEVSSSRCQETFQPTVLARCFEGYGPSCLLMLDTPRRSAVLRKDETDLAQPARLEFSTSGKGKAGRHEAKTWPALPRKMQVR